MGVLYLIQQRLCYWIQKSTFYLIRTFLVVVFFVYFIGIITTLNRVEPTALNHARKAPIFWVFVSQITISTDTFQPFSLVLGFHEWYQTRKVKKSSDRDKTQSNVAKK